MYFGAEKLHGVLVSGTGFAALGELFFFFPPWMGSLFPGLWSKYPKHQTLWVLELVTVKIGFMSYIQIRTKGREAEPPAALTEVSNYAWAVQGMQWGYKLRSARITNGQGTTSCAVWRGREYVFSPHHGLPLSLSLQSCALSCAQQKILDYASGSQVLASVSYFRGLSEIII